MNGVDITVTVSQFQFPAVCCRCEGPQEQWVETSHYDAGSRVRRSVQVPYCGPCARRRSAIGSRRTVVVLSASAIGLLVALLALLVPWLPMVLLVAIPAALALVAGIVLRVLAGASIDDPEGMRITSFSGGTTHFHCVNGGFGQRFAAAHGAACTPKSRSDRMLHVPWLVAVLLSGVLATVLAFVTNPTVHVFNASSSKMQVWLDGSRVLEVGAGKHGSLRVPYGGHAFGWSTGKSKKPRESTQVAVVLSGNHLYNPGRLGCFYLDVSTYGSASDKGYEQGMLPLRAFYSLARVDNWFADNPRSVKTKSSGEVRVALKSLTACGQMAEAGCTREQRETFVDCLREAAPDKSAMDECFEQARSACGGQEQDDAE